MSDDNGRVGLPPDYDWKAAMSRFGLAMAMGHTSEPSILTNDLNAPLPSRPPVPTREDKERYVEVWGGDPTDGERGGADGR